MKNKARALVEKFKVFKDNKHLNGFDAEYDLLQAKESAIYCIDFAKQELKSHSVVRDEYYDQFKKEVLKL